MKPLSASKIILAIGLPLLLISCGGSGSSSDSSDSSDSSFSLIGRYALNSFTIVTSNQETVTQENFSSFSGTLTIDEDGTFEELGELNGESGTASGTWSLLSDNSASITEDGCTEIFDFTFNNGVFTTTDTDLTCNDGISSSVQRYVRL